MNMTLSAWKVHSGEGQTESRNKSKPERRIVNVNTSNVSHLKLGEFTQ